MHFAADDLGEVRRYAAGCALAAGLSADRAEDVRLVVNEAATNAIEHGGGHGLIRSWISGSTLTIETSNDGGAHLDPSAGRLFPDPSGRRGRGLWMMRQLADALDIRAQVGRTIVQMHFKI